MVVAGLFTLGWLSISEGVAKEVQRITKEELKSQLGSADVMVLDVRSGKDWTSSELKIQGAVREDPKEIETWHAKYAKDKKIIVYCA